jgi:hypothetical protein
MLPAEDEPWPEDERTWNPDDQDRKTARQESPRVGDVLRLIRSLERTGDLDDEAVRQIREAAVSGTPQVGGEIACDTCGKVFHFQSAALRSWDRGTDTEDNEVWFHSGSLPVGNMWACIKSVVGIFYSRIPGFYCLEDCQPVDMGGWLIPRGFERGQERVWRRGRRLESPSDMCGCAHVRSFHTGENGKCIGTGADLDGDYNVDPDEACACEEFVGEDN